MTASQKKAICDRGRQLATEIRELSRVRSEILMTGFSSATLSNGQGTRSYTRLDVHDLNEAILTATRELNVLSARLAGRSASVPSQIYQSWI